MKNQRDEHSSTFLSGTNQIAEKAFLYSNPDFDDRKALEELSYTTDECYVSPDRMVKYECIDEFDIAKFFSEHKDMPSSDPDFTGARVKKYATLVELASNLTAIHSIFVEDEAFPAFFPEHFDRTNIVNFRSDCDSNDCKHLFRNAKMFSREAVLKWNPDADKITPTMFMGLNALDESASTETGAIVLDLLLSAGVITKDENGAYNLADENKFHCTTYFMNAGFESQVTGKKHQCSESCNTTQIGANQFDVFSCDLPSCNHPSKNRLCDEIHFTFWRCKDCRQYQPHPRHDPQVDE